MPTCSAPGCNSGSKKKDLLFRQFFHCPKDTDRLAEWNGQIPHGGVLLTSENFLCDLHFESHFIVKSFDAVIDGEKVTVPQCLTDTAVPTLFPNVPKSFSNSSTRRKGCPVKLCISSSESGVSVSDDLDTESVTESRTSDAVSNCTRCKVLSTRLLQCNRSLKIKTGQVCMLMQQVKQLKEANDHLTAKLHTSATHQSKRKATSEPQEPIYNQQVTSVPFVCYKTPPAEVCTFSTDGEQQNNQTEASANIVETNDEYIVKHEDDDELCNLLSSHSSNVYQQLCTLYQGRDVQQPTDNSPQLIKPYICDTCGKGFSRAGHLYDHKFIHTGGRSYTCRTCEKVFNRHTNLRRHERMHVEGKRRYICDVCSKAFSEAHHLHEHKLIHSGDKPHRCHICCKSFNRRANLTRHRRVHTGDKPFVCGSCSKAFVQHSHLRKHKCIRTDDVNTSEVQEAGVCAPDIESG